MLFDFPLMSYTHQQVNKAEDKVYFRPIDENGKPCRRQSIELLKVDADAMDPSNLRAPVKSCSPYEKVCHKQYRMIEIDKNNYQRSYSPFWQTLKHATINRLSNKDSMIIGAIEGKYRQDRVNENMNTAFTYGKQIKLKDLYDPHYHTKVVRSLKNKSSQSNRNRAAFDIETPGFFRYLKQSATNKQVSFPTTNDVEEESQ